MSRVSSKLYHFVFERELHHASGNRDTTFFFPFPSVSCCCTVRFTAFHHTKQPELLAPTTTVFLVIVVLPASGWRIVKCTSLSDLRRAIFLQKLMRATDRKLAVQDLISDQYGNWPYCIRLTIKNNEPQW